MLKIKVLGYKEAKKVLDQLSDEMRKTIVRSTLRRTSKPMLQSAVSHAPVGGTRKVKVKGESQVVHGGALKSSIRMASIPKSKTSIAAVIIAPIFGRYKYGKINSYYGRMVHQGTKRGITADPFLLHAFDQTKEQVINGFGTALAKAVTSFVRRKFKPITK